MPTSEQILLGLTAVANDWVVVSVAWHVAIAVALVAILAGWRPSRRLAPILIAALPASAAVVAVASGNPFNGIVLATTTLALVIAGGNKLEAPAPTWARVTGLALIAFGWTYPHFMQGDTVTYLYAAPVGLVPCPTLSMAIGLALFGNVGGTVWRRVLAGAGVFYAVFGMFRLGVLLDLGLLLGAVAIAASSVRRTHAVPSLHTS